MHNLIAPHIAVYIALYCDVVEATGKQTADYSATASIVIYTLLRLRRSRDDTCSVVHTVVHVNNSVNVPDLTDTMEVT